MNRIILLAAALMLSFSGLYAQNNNPQYRGKNAGYGRIYNPATTISLEGTITDIEHIANKRGRGYGVHIKLQADDNTYDVHLGPSWYINKQDMKLKVNDHISVMGSKVTYEGEEVIIAARIEKGSEVMMLRDQNGVPEWAGNGRRNR